MTRQLPHVEVTDRCEGVGLCRQLAPDVFVARQDGHAVVVEDGLRDADPDNLTEAAELCPTEAIVVELATR